ncbi:phosphotransferase system sugar-specific permease component [Lucifera butyrica]|uniref:Phosphotransferase system sugar-specific permease component n=1 Tax=Lucifera butyrica TaxID=1351585 RepID=A0A498R7W0_9FIRM|nr:PTS transporter subunit IIC [Lucifera butyrica]VBB07269.1 phosphotransferase system sugar-specific permease component [Lucifera butyrica]
MDLVVTITNILSAFFKFDSTVTIVGIILIVSLLVRVPLKKAIAGALKVSIGLTGLFLVVNLIQEAMIKPITSMVALYGFNKSIIDIGWGSVGYAFGNTYGYFGVLVFLIVDVILVTVRFTQTLYVDVFNTWRAMLLAGLVGVASGSFWLATLAVVVFLIIDVKAADIAAPYIEKINNFPPGGSWPHGTHFSFQACIAIPIEWCLRRIPVIKNIQFNAETIEEKFGVLGETTVMGAVLGIIIGAFSQIGIMPSLLLGVKMAAAFLLLPRMAAILVEGWFPIIKSARSILVSKLNRDDVRIALDCSTVIGHSAVIPTALIMYPIALLISLILPGCQMIASVSLIIILWESAAVNAITEGNILHNLIILSLIVCLFCWGATFMADSMTHLAQTMGYDASKGLISNWDAAGTPGLVLVYKVFSWIFGF